MAATITYRVTINPWVGTVSSNNVEGGSDDEVILSAAQLTALRDSIAAIKGGLLSAVSLSSIQTIVTASNAADADYDATNAQAVLDFLTEIVAGTDVSAVVTAIDAL